MERIFFSLLFLLCIGTNVLTSCGGTNAEKSNSDSTKVATAENTNDILLNADERKEFNTFFSNFAETMLMAFDENAVSEQELITFGVMHNFINNQKRIERIDDYNIKLKKEYVEESIYYYFGLNFKNHKSVEGLAYANGYYTFPDAGGEAFYFSQIQKLSKNTDNTFTAIVQNYVAGSGFTGDVHALPSTWNTPDEPSPETAGKFAAKIKKVSENGKEHYVLLSYKSL